MYDKEVAVIYNPTSGKQKDISELVATRLESHGIRTKFFQTLRYMHALDLAREEINLAEFSAILAVGGDGTMHEVINGMLKREDGLRVPIALVPNGSGNDLVNSFNVRDVDQALEWICKGELIKMDINKVLLDYEHEDDIPAEQRHMKLRYSCINTGCGFAAKVVHKADAHKPYVGSACYTTAALANFFATDPDTYDVRFEQEDGSVIEMPNEPTMLLMVMNGKFGGSGTPFTPCSYLNDGLLDVCFHTGPGGLGLLRTYIRHAMIAKGMHFYKPVFSYFRAKSIRVTNKMVEEGGQ